MKVRVKVKKHGRTSTVTKLRTIGIAGFNVVGGRRYTVRVTLTKAGGKLLVGARGGVKATLLISGVPSAKAASVRLRAQLPAKKTVTKKG